MKSFLNPRVKGKAGKLAHGPCYFRKAFYRAKIIRKATLETGQFKRFKEAKEAARVA